jgi:hypothetical protein
MHRTSKAFVLGLLTLLVAFYLILSSSRTPKDSSSAYVFYATQDVYACSVAVNIYLLKRVFHTQHRIFVFLSTDISSSYRSLIQMLDASIIDEEPLPLHDNTIPYYRGCLLKLSAFRMHEIDASISRVLVLDADQLIMHNLDHLFALPPNDFLAPTAYWISSTFLSSTLMLIQPNQDQWRLVKEALLNPQPQQYDMDIVNVLFKPSYHLHGRYITINSHWEDWNLPPWFNPSITELRSTQSPASVSEKDLDELYDQAGVIHFCAIGKPWTYSLQQVKEMKPEGHKLLFESWRIWRSLAINVCPVGTIVQI